MGDTGECVMGDRGIVIFSKEREYIEEMVFCPGL